MSIKKFPITKDTTITNAFRESLSTRGDNANMGLSDSLETFFIYGQTPDPEANAEDNKEEARTLRETCFEMLQQSALIFVHRDKSYPYVPQSTIYLSFQFYVYF